MIEEILKNKIREAIDSADTEVLLDRPTDLSRGDYSSNIAMVLAKKLKKNPVALAEEIVEKLSKNKPEEVEKIEAVAPGFINFYLTKKYFTETVENILKNPTDFGKTKSLEGQKVVIEYTDPNPFKQFHIGHLMSNTIGEALSRIIESNGAKLKRACYQGDVGRHVALTIYGIRLMKNPFPEESMQLDEKVSYLGRAYALGATTVKDNPDLEKDIQIINRKVYERSDEEVNWLYNQGREWSLEHFEELYKKLGTRFDHYFFESVAAPIGTEIVRENLKKGVFEESEGAIIFAGEKYDLHTRVFITKENLPTYEAKDLGLSKIKYDTFPFDSSIVITANEQSGYFKVLLKVISLIFPEIGKTMKHVSHGMLRIAAPGGGSTKMSSRTGDVVTAESLIAEAEDRVEEKMKDRDLSGEFKKEIIVKVAVAALKYSILKQSPGKDIIFELDKALSFEGDSGPYLQYSYVRARSVLGKAEKQSLSSKEISSKQDLSADISSLEQLLPRLPEIVERAAIEYAPQLITSYLIELAASFNKFYASNKILDAGEETAYRLSLTESFSIVMKNGLNILGIETPEKM